ncbi:MAG: hypothetical protein K5622_06725 [Endomicrobiaceae bacterium]|nr:hypothetical protein [Endomicrobiaceae bacterium]
MPEKDIKEQVTWMPSLKWLCKSFIIIIAFLIITFFVLNFLLKSYMRDIPMEITPWLDKTSQQSQNNSENK